MNNTLKFLNRIIIMASTYLNLPAFPGWRAEAPNLRCGDVGCCWGGAAKCNAGNMILLLLGLLANLTIIGSVPFFGTLPFSSFIASSASARWSKRMKPTPFENPETGRGRHPLDSLHIEWNIYVASIQSKQYRWMGSKQEGWDDNNINIQVHKQGHFTGRCMSCCSAGGGGGGDYYEASWRHMML